MFQLGQEVCLLLEEHHNLELGFLSHMHYIHSHEISSELGKNSDIYSALRYYSMHLIIPHWTSGNTK